MTAIDLVQPVGDSMAPGLMEMAAIMITTIPIVTVCTRWIARAIRSKF